MLGWKQDGSGSDSALDTLDMNLYVLMNSRCVAYCRNKMELGWFDPTWGIGLIKLDVGTNVVCCFNDFESGT